VEARQIDASAGVLTADATSEWEHRGCSAGYPPDARLVAPESGSRAEGDSRVSNTGFYGSLPRALDVATGIELSTELTFED
jgi:hypothetical protein